LFITGYVAFQKINVGEKNNNSGEGMKSQFMIGKVAELQSAFNHSG